MKLMFALLLLTASAFGQILPPSSRPPRLAPPDQQVHHTEHIGIYIITYFPAHQDTHEPDVRLQTEDTDVSCNNLGTEEKMNIECHNTFDRGHAPIANLILRNFHGHDYTLLDTAVLPAKLSNGPDGYYVKCDPLEELQSSARAHKAPSATFSYKESGRDHITVEGRCGGKITAVKYLVNLRARPL